MAWQPRQGHAPASVVRIVVLVVLAMVGPAMLASPARADQLVVQEDDLYEIWPGETQFFSLHNGATTTAMVLNWTFRCTGNSTHVLPSVKVDVFAWSTYEPGKPDGDATATTTGHVASVPFTCQLDHRYVIRVRNEGTEDVVMGLELASDPGVPFHPYFNDVEQPYVAGKIAFGYFFTTDPWLYDSFSGPGRLTLSLGYVVYGALAPISSYGERYFTIQNVLDRDVWVFVGMTAYSLSSLGNMASHTLGVTTWDALDAGGNGWLALSYTISNYSTGFLIKCAPWTTYQVYLKNGDYYGLFANVTFWTPGGERIRFDDDLDPEPLDDEVRVRAFSFDPWLEQARLAREVQLYWIAGIGSGAGVLVALFFLHRRYR